MTKKMNLKWRLSKLPTPDELRELVKDKIITQEEAKEVLFSQEEIKEPEDRDVESLEAEIKFLRETIQQLASRDKIVETIRYIEKPYQTLPWYGPYAVWCNAGLNTSSVNAVYLSGGSASNLANASYSITSTANDQSQLVSWSNDTPFGNIQTF